MKRNLMQPILFSPSTPSPSSAMERLVLKNFNPNTPNVLTKAGQLHKDQQHRDTLIWMLFLTKKWIRLAVVVVAVVGVPLFIMIWATNGTDGDMAAVMDTFSLSEVHIQDIPFPAVTICNKNLISKRLVQKLQLSLTNYSNAKTKEEQQKYLQARKQLTYVNLTCHQYQSFAKSFGFAQSRGVLDLISAKVVADATKKTNGNGIADFWLQNSASCDNLIRLCLWKQEKINCSKLFKPILTQFGKCCTFNSLPHKLRYRSRTGQNSKSNENDDKTEDEGKDDKSGKISPIGRNRTEDWTSEEIEAWKQWNYTKNFILPANELPYPYRQEIPGVSYGLSILIDDDTQDYFCPMRDSRGVRFKLHSPLETPAIEDFGASIGISREFFIEVTPEVTIMELEAKFLPNNGRKCFLGNEHNLTYYYPYTIENCRQECLGKAILETCDCVPFYMPRTMSTRTCNLDPNDKDFECVLNTKNTVGRNLSRECSGCWPLCMDVSYRSQSTVSTLQLRSQLWHDADPKVWNQVPTWASNPMSIVHFYFGHATTVPRIRKVQTFTSSQSTFELIAQTGGISSLCLLLGFSILSLIELIYICICKVIGRPRREHIWSWSCQKCRGGREGVMEGSGQVEHDVVVRIPTNNFPVSPTEKVGYPMKSIKTGSGTMSPLYPHYHPNNWIPQEHSPDSTPLKSI